jgi:hypothetical protein
MGVMEISDLGLFFVCGELFKTNYEDTKHANESLYLDAICILRVYLCLRVKFSRVKDAPIVKYNNNDPFYCVAIQTEATV